MDDDSYLQSLNYWFDMRARFQAGLLVFDPDTCVQLADRILNVSFRDTVFPFRSLIQIWLRKVVICLNNEVFERLALAQAQVPPPGPGVEEAIIIRLNESITAAGRRARDELCSTTRSDSERRRHTLALLQRLPNTAVPGTPENDAFALISTTADMEFSKPLVKEQDILSQAAAIVIVIVRGYACVNDCMWDVPTFRAEFHTHGLRNGRTFFQDLDENMDVLLWNANIMRIAKMFIDPIRGKGRYMQIASALCESRHYVTGGGNFPASQRREKLFEIIGEMPVQQRAARNRGGGGGGSPRQPLSPTAPLGSPGSTSTSTGASPPPPPPAKVAVPAQVPVPHQQQAVPQYQQQFSPRKHQQQMYGQLTPESLQQLQYHHQQQQQQQQQLLLQQQQQYQQRKMYKLSPRQATPTAPLQHPSPNNNNNNNNNNSSSSVIIPNFSPQQQQQQYDDTVLYVEPAAAGGPGMMKRDHSNSSVMDEHSHRHKRLLQQQQPQHDVHTAYNTELNSYTSAPARAGELDFTIFPASPMYEQQQQQQQQQQQVRFADRQQIQQVIADSPNTCQTLYRNFDTLVLNEQPQPFSSHTTPSASPRQVFQGQFNYVDRATTQMSSHVSPQDLQQFRNQQLPLHLHDKGGDLPTNVDHVVAADAPDAPGLPLLKSCSTVYADDGTVAPLYDPVGDDCVLAALATEEEADHDRTLPSDGGRGSLRLTMSALERHQQQQLAQLDATFGASFAQGGAVEVDVVVPSAPPPFHAGFRRQSHSMGLPEPLQHEHQQGRTYSEEYIPLNDEEVPDVNLFPSPSPSGPPTKRMERSQSSTMTATMLMQLDSNSNFELVDYSEEELRAILPAGADEVLPVSMTFSHMSVNDDNYEGSSHNSNRDAVGTRPV